MIKGTWPQSLEDKRSKSLQNRKQHQNFICYLAHYQHFLKMLIKISFKLFKLICEQSHNRQIDIELHDLLGGDNNDCFFENYESHDDFCLINKTIWRYKLKSSAGLRGSIASNHASVKI